MAGLSFVFTDRSINSIHFLSVLTGFSYFFLTFLMLILNFDVFYLLLQSEYLQTAYKTLIKNVLRGNYLFSSAYFTLKVQDFN